MTSSARFVVAGAALTLCTLCALGAVPVAAQTYNSQLPAQAVIGSTSQRQAAYNSLTPAQRQAAIAKIQPYMQSAFINALIQHRSSISNQDLLVHAAGLDGAMTHDLSQALGLQSQLTVTGAGGAAATVMIYPAAQSAFAANSPSGQIAGADLDHDGLPDAFENQLAAEFTPFYHVSGGDPDNFATFLNQVPEVVDQLLGPHPFSYFRVQPLSFATSTAGVEYGFIRVDYLTLWDHDSGLSIGGDCDTLIGLAGGILGFDLLNLLNVQFFSHALDDEHGAALLAAPTVNGAFNLDPSQYVAVSYYTAAHEGTLFDHSEFINPSTPITANNHIVLYLSRNKHSTYVFDPDGLPIVPGDLIAIYYLTLDELLAAGIIDDLTFLAFQFVGDTVFFDCVIEHFDDQGGAFASSQVNVGEPAAGSILNDAGFILDPHHVLPKLTELLWLPVVPPIIVNVSPAAAALDESQAQQFQAAVSNAPGNSQNVTWAISPATGSITQAGLYTAPAPVPAMQTVTVSACSTSDAARCGTALVLLNPVAVAVSPQAATLSPSQSQQFTAAVTHGTSSSVSWSISPQVGTIGASGLYTAPATIASQQAIAVTACSVADATKCDTATVTLLPPAAINSLSPASGAVGSAVTIAGANFGATQGASTVTFAGVAAGVTSWSGASIVVAVPNLPAGAAAVQVTVNAYGSNTSTFTVTPTVTALSPAAGPVGTSVTVAGSNFGATQGASRVTIAGTAVAPASWSAGSIVFTVPASLPAGQAAVQVTVNGAASNSVPFTVIPGIGSLSPASGPVGTAVTVAGTDFGAAQGSSAVTFNGTPAAVSSWSNLAVVVTVPGSVPAGAAGVVVTVGGLASNAAAFTVLPGIAGINPPSGPTGACVTVAGTDFGATQGASTVTFAGVTATVSSWANTSVAACVPAGLAAGGVPVVIAVNGVASAAASFTVTPAITAVSPAAAPVGAAVTLAGTSFGASQGSSTVTFNGTAAAASAWSNTSLTVTVPAAATSGSLVVTVNGVASNAVAFTVTPTVTGLSPASGPVGTVVTVQGNNFGAAQGSSTVTFNGIAAAASSWSATSVAVAVPGGLGAGAANVVVTVGGASSNAAAFTVTAAVASLSPSFGPVGTLVTINGTSFGTSQGSGTVAFNGLAATVSSWSNASVVAAVPAGATTGNVVVTAAGLPSNGARFVVTAPSVFDLTATASSTPGLMQLSSTLGAAASFPSPNLANQPAGDYLIQAFDTQAGIPNSTNSWPAGLNATFVVWMQQTAGTAGTLFPEVALYLNGPTGTPICSVVGSAALSATNTQFNLSCAPAATVNLAAADRWYLRVGVHSTAASSSALQAQTGVGTQVRGRPAASVTVPIQ
jgi:IPT/TIG domain/Bacterial Ig-like domain (group 2)